MDPGQGVSPRRPRAATAPVSSQTSMLVPVSAQSAVDLAPTLILNGVPITTGDGMSHTARLVACGMVLITTGSELPACRMPPTSCGSTVTVQACSPTWRGAVTVMSPASTPAAAGAAPAGTPSGPMMRNGTPRSSHPSEHDTLTLSTRSAPTGTSVGSGSLNSITVECVCITLVRYAHRPKGRWNAVMSLSGCCKRDHLGPMFKFHGLELVTLQQNWPGAEVSPKSGYLSFLRTEQSAIRIRSSGHLGRQTEADDRVASARAPMIEIFTQAVQGWRELGAVGLGAL